MAHLREQLELMSVLGPGDGRPTPVVASSCPGCGGPPRSPPRLCRGFETFSERHLAQCFLNGHGEVHDHAPPNPPEIDDENRGRPTSVLMPGCVQAWR